MLITSESMSLSPKLQMSNTLAPGTTSSMTFSKTSTFKKERDTCKFKRRKRKETKLGLS